MGDAESSYLNSWPAIKCGQITFPRTRLNSEMGHWMVLVRLVSAKVVLEYSFIIIII